MSTGSRIWQLVAAGATEDDEHGTGRIPLAENPDASVRSLEASLQETVEPASELHADAWPGAAGVARPGNAPPRDEPAPEPTTTDRRVQESIVSRRG